jgi:hypothetical protein
VIVGGKAEPDFLLGLFFGPEDGGDMFLLNVCRLSTDYTALYERIFITAAARASSFPWTWSLVIALRHGWYC